MYVSLNHHVRTSADLVLLSVTMNKAKKRDKEEARLIKRHESEQAEREATRRDQFESRQRVDGAFRAMDRTVENAALRNAQEGKAKGAQRMRYQFEATNSDDELEDELDSNLEQIGGIAERLKMLAMTAGQEVDVSILVPASLLPPCAD